MFITNEDIIDRFPANEIYIENIQMAIGNLLSFYIDKHNKAFLTRITLTFPQSYCYDVGYSYISNFTQKLIQFLKRNNYDPYYIWAREQNTSVNPHYHIVILVNGTLIQHPFIITSKAEELWASTLGVPSTGLINYDMSIAIRRNENGFSNQLQQAVDAASYLAKEFSKGKAGDGVRNFGMSRIPPLFYIKNDSREYAMGTVMFSVSLCDQSHQ